MKVSELREIVPSAEAYELSPDARYLVKLPANMAPPVIERLYELLTHNDIRAVIVIGDEIKFYDLGQ